MSKTHISGRNGTIKEIYGLDDWQIRIRGLCLDTPQESSRDQQKRLLEYENISESIGVIGKLFNDKKIDRISIEEMDFKQLEGSPNIIPFEISALSDGSGIFSI